MQFRFQVLPKHQNFRLVYDMHAFVSLKAILNGTLRFNYVEVLDLRIDLSQLLQSEC